MHLKNCFDCGVIITPKSRRTLRCAECAKSRKKVLQKKWAQNNREHIMDYNRRWYIAMIHAQEKIAVIRRKHLRGVSEIEMRVIKISACNTCPYIDGNPHTGYFCKAQEGKKLIYFDPDENDCKLERINE
jgi:hypothetical protein